MDEPTRFREIAADLQAKIESGKLPPGKRLPSDAELTKTYRASRNTVREAVRLLTTRRLVDKQPGGRGTFVRAKIDPFITPVTAVTGFGGLEGGYASGDTTEKRELTVTTRVELQEASADIVGELRLSEGEAIVLRHQLRLIGGELWSMQTSYYPKSFVDNGATRLLEVKNIAEGTRKYLASVGIKETSWQDTMRVRVPNPGEAAAFGIPDDGWVPVFETRQIGVDASGMPIRLTISIYPGDRNQFSMKTSELADPP